MSHYDRCRDDEHKDDLCTEQDIDIEQAFSKLLKNDAEESLSAQTVNMVSDIVKELDEQKKSIYPVYASLAKYAYDCFKEQGFSDEQALNLVMQSTKLGGV